MWRFGKTSARCGEAENKSCVLLESVRISDDFILRYVKAWSRDMVCLDQNWFDIKAGPVKFLAKETRTTCLSAVDRNLRYGKMVTEIMVKYERAFLDAKYSLRSKRAFLRFREFVGAVSHTEWLTGAVVYYGETAICDGRDGCLVLSSYDLDGHFPAGRDLFSYKLVVMLVSTHGMHWTLIMVYINNGDLVVHFYDPLGSSHELKRIW
ncbi:hypothetical protein GN244_ATG17598 [Phytophthora infestans]|uniref:Ubiquitin-like protease family profile domain-containing protein n=1 Tax=Phytophthora infestans TaxID=4787 RepID=A0A833WL08_PHYIN|nr:hypothetical protein GN244_ATG17598 [Phytophthora infestans]